LNRQRTERCARFDVYVHAIHDDAERTRDVHSAKRRSFSCQVATDALRA
jgi:hypothetical protein